MREDDSILQTDTSESAEAMELRAKNERIHHEVYTRIMEKYNTYDWEKRYFDMSREDLLAERSNSPESGLSLAAAALQIHELLDSLTVWYGDLEFVKDQRVLDLGCGAKSRKSKEDPPSDTDGIGGLKFTYKRYQPWFPRVLVELGAEPVGIDIGNLDGEDFEHYQRDLSESGALDFLPDKSFDAVHMSLLLTSPVMEASPSGQRSKAELEEIRHEINRQVARLLKNGGKKLEDFPEQFDA